MEDKMTIIMGALGVLASFVLLIIGVIMKRASKLMELIPVIEGLDKVQVKFDKAIEKLDALIADAKVNNFRMDTYDSKLKGVEQKVSLLENKINELEKICVKNHLGG